MTSQFLGIRTEAVPLVSPQSAPSPPTRLPGLKPLFFFCPSREEFPCLAKTAQHGVSPSVDRRFW
jgi:hypothetical protein